VHIGTLRLTVSVDRGRRVHSRFLRLPCMFASSYSTHAHTERVPWKPPKLAWTALNSSISARAGTGFAAMPDGMLYVIGGGVGGTNSVICLLCATCCYNFI
jgi:hypothetical protein